MDPLHNIKAAAMRTGLTPHVIRIWESRYHAVVPRRTDGGHRLYCEGDIERLALLAELTRLGHSICRIAPLGTCELKAAVQAARTACGAQPQPGQSGPCCPDAMLARMLEAVAHYRIETLERLLDESAVRLGHSGLIERVLVPLMQRIGEEWHAGRMTAAQEHAATSAVKDYLAGRLRPMNVPESAPRLLVTTPAGQLHEMGAAIAAALARKEGWNVTYLGPSLPAEEIVGAALTNDFRAVALSIVYPADDPDMAGQLVRLRSLLPDEVEIIIGGRAAFGYADVIGRIGAIVVTCMGSFTKVLSDVRDGNLRGGRVNLLDRPASRSRGG